MEYLESSCQYDWIRGLCDGRGGLQGEAQCHHLGPFTQRLQYSSQQFLDGKLPYPLRRLLENAIC